jgi:hypothetical protein
MKKHAAGYYIAIISIYLACIVVLAITALLSIYCFKRISAGDFTNPFDQFLKTDMWDIEYWKTLLNIQ